MAGFGGLNGFGTVNDAQVNDAQVYPAVDQGKYGIRPDGSRKGVGFLGEIPMSSGDVMTELSIGINFDGQERLIPLIVPTLSSEEIEHLSGGGEATREIIDKAVRHASERLYQNLSPFYEEQEQVFKGMHGNLNNQ